MTLTERDAKMHRLIIVGDGEIAEIAYEYFTYDSRYAVVAFSVEKNYLKKKQLFGLPVVPFEELEHIYDKKTHKAFVAVSYTQLNRLRQRLYIEVKSKGFALASYVSSKAVVWRNAEIGENSCILENNVIQYRAKIGNNVVLWSGNHIGHRTVVADNVFVAGQVIVAGYSQIAENSFLGVNSCVADGIKIGKDCIIGAGAVVIRDTEDGRVYVGNPAKPTEKNSYMAFGVPKHLI